MRSARAFLGQCWVLIAEDRPKVFLFVVLATIVALTEGVGVSLLVPLLNAQSGVDSMRSIPVLGLAADLLAADDVVIQVRRISLAILVVVLIRGLLQFFVESLGASIPLSLLRRLTNDSYNGLLEAELGYLNSSQVGDLKQGISGNPLRVSNLLVVLATTSWSIFLLLAYLGMMVAVSPSLTLGAAAFAVFMTLILRHRAREVRGAGEMMTRANGEVDSLIHETIGGMRLIRLSNCQSLMAGRFSLAMGRSVEAQRRVARLAATTSPLMATAAGIFICTVLLISSAIADPGDRGWLSTALLFMFLLMRLLGPVSTLNWARVRIAADSHAMETLKEFHAAITAARQVDGTKTIPSLERCVAFENVSFTYPKGDRQVLDDISLDLPKGSMVALVGPSGAGKSSLVSLLVRFYDPSSGRITVDGTDLRDLNLPSWRQRVAVVSQDIFIFNDTIRENIRFGVVDATDADIEHAAAMAAATEFIAKLPSGYDTIVGDAGMRLSGGQRQRLAIARALLRRPDLLIFDEATSHLDSVSENAVKRSMDVLRRESTTLVIAHRLATVQMADKIVVVDHGRIVETGTHQELLLHQGIYAQLVKGQDLMA